MLDSSWTKKNVNSNERLPCKDDVDGLKEPKKGVLNFDLSVLEDSTSQSGE